QRPEMQPSGQIARVHDIAGNTMIRIERSHLVSSLHDRPAASTPREPWRSILASLVTGLALLVFSTPAPAQDAPLRVVVEGQTYAVAGSSVAGSTGREPITSAIVEKARFTARVLDEHILRSEQNKLRYSATSRALVFADATPARLAQPWLRS